MGQDNGEALAHVGVRLNAQLGLWTGARCFKFTATPLGLSVHKFQTSFASALNDQLG